MYHNGSPDILSIQLCSFRLEKGFDCVFHLSGLSNCSETFSTVFKVFKTMSIMSLDGSEEEHDGDNWYSVICYTYPMNIIWTVFSCCQLTFSWTPTWISWPGVCSCLFHNTLQQHRPRFGLWNVLLQIESRGVLIFVQSPRSPQCKCSIKSLSFLFLFYCQFIYREFVIVFQLKSVHWIKN